MTGGEADVAILMALHNGARHLSQQLESLAAQSHRQWHLIVSDDGSQDDGPALLQRFAAGRPQGQVRLLAGPGQGFARNFLHLLQAAGPDVPMAALSDQDDLWLPEKLARAVEALARLPPNRPALFCARTLICDADLRPLAPSPRWRRPFGFANALVQNVAAGNTIVLNRAALDLAQTLAPLAGVVPAHDWWLYQIVTGAGGIVLRDDRPALLYRQHPGNLMGRNDTPRAALARAARLGDGTFRRWVDANLANLASAQAFLTPEARTRLAIFAEARQAPVPARLRGLGRAGIYRQTRRGTAAMWTAAALGRL
ncbi:glycosyltransferase family 2 protein [Plastorhodobacter daqingensis]|uniref:Glycosyltransferase family 2 protein n=1 Tax=Plastorhodobacter daqingensis TaxID=1387281 RepID=A0ABW2UJ94_9RHOB